MGDSMVRGEGSGSEYAAQRISRSAHSFAPHVDSRKRVISLSHVTFHAGHRHDVGTIGKLCQQHGLYLIVDAMQSVGVLPVDVRKMGISVLAAGCHKGLLVPQGLGILHLPGLHALNASIELIARIGVGNIEQHVLALGERLIEHMDAQGIRLVGPRTRENRSHIYVLDLRVAEWSEYFAQNQVRVSPERDGIRISFAMFNTIEEVDQLAEIIRRRRSNADQARGVEQIDCFDK